MWARAPKGFAVCAEALFQFYGMAPSIVSCCVYRTNMSTRSNSTFDGVIFN